MTMWMRFFDSVAQRLRMTFIRIFRQFEDANKDEILTTPLHSAQDDIMDEILTTPLRSAQDDSIGQNDDADRSLDVARDDSGAVN